MSRPTGNGTTQDGLIFFFEINFQIYGDRRHECALLEQFRKARQGCRERQFQVPTRFFLRLGIGETVGVTKKNPQKDAHSGMRLRA